MPHSVPSMLDMEPAASAVTSSACGTDAGRRRRVLLLHGSPIMHYRVPVYNYFRARFQKDGVDFSVAGPDIPPDMAAAVRFPYHPMRRSLQSWLRAIRAEQAEAVILFSGLRNLFILPLIVLLRALRIPVIYWGHGVRLSNTDAHRRLYTFLHRSCNSIILYSEDLKRYVAEKYWANVFVANNTLYLGDLPEPPSPDRRRLILRRHGVETQQNIIFTGRMQVRKRIGELLAAVHVLNRPDLGVVLVGPDTERVLPKRMPERVVHIPGLYGPELFELMMACDVYCCPGWVGLNIVDAMACGLPFVTAAQESHAPEIMYLKNGRNGLLVPEARAHHLADGLARLLDDAGLRQKMAAEARDTYRREASIERMYEGFISAINHVVA